MQLFPAYCLSLEHLFSQNREQPPLLLETLRNDKVNEDWN